MVGSIPCFDMNVLTRTYLSLGTNLGNRRQNLERAIELLTKAGIPVIRRSSVYETAPRDLLDQPSFLNMVVECETDWLPIQLMETVLGVESAMGRVRELRWGPRLIDIDVLLFGDVVMEAETLVIPHPRMLERRFVLAPLLELDSEIRDPRSSRFMREYLAPLQGQEIEKLNA